PLRRTYELLAARLKLARYDGRGIGLSQRGVENFSLETMLADLDAVVKALGAPKVALLGLINSGAVAIAYAARYPERVSHLVLWCPLVDGSVHGDNPRLQATRQVLETDWELYTRTVAHALLGWTENEAALQFAAFIRTSITQDTARALVPEIIKLNVWDALSRVRCPTLILHRPALPLFPAGLMERVAAGIPNSQLALMKGDSAVPWLGDWQALPRVIYRFMGLAPGSAPGRTRSLKLLSMRQGSLTRRERDVVDLVVRGLTNRQIAEELFLSEKTVENHIGRILVKMDLPSRTRLAAYAIEHGLTKSA
ncbi:MAG TPA: alpha/beta fold hydrolase, partial [Dehalococcoidia bacterium]|nr:alpha/beta fold hydrolase [Dehalococcoidia bacterium]